MSYRDWQLRIQDILKAIDSIQKRTEGMSFEKFVENETVIKAVLYDFIVIGEAASNIPTEVKANNSDIPWRQMSAMRNIVAHEYFQVSLKITLEFCPDELDC
ncbi:MAG: DUF86 domain-containing protein [Xenococcaceae cyanobacterium]